MDEAPEAALVWQAPEECRQLAFEERLGARGRTRPMQVRIDRTTGATPYRGEVTIGNLKRSVDGAECDEVVRALALVSNMLLDSEPEVPATPVAAQQKNVEPDVMAPAPLAPRYALSAALWIGGGAAYDGQRAVPVLSAGALTIIRWKVPIGVGLEFAGRFTSAEVSTYRVNLLWATTRIHGCAFLFGRSTLRLGGCALVELGVNHGEAEGSLDATARARFWAAIGPSLSAYWVPGPRNTPFVGLRVSALFPVTRDRFVLSEGPVLFTSPLVAPELGLSLGYLFQ